jgi:hypothetical protein
MPDEQVILEITTGKTREIQFLNIDGELEAVLPYAKSSPAGLMIEALVKLCRVQIETSPPHPETKVSKV